MYTAEPGTTARLDDRFPWATASSANKWYFDELYDIAVRPADGGRGSFGRTVIETAFVQDTIVGGAAGVVRGHLNRRCRPGDLRAYACCCSGASGSPSTS